MKDTGKRSRRVTALALTLMLAGCSTTTGFGGTDARGVAMTRTALDLVCVTFPPISWSMRDTPETIAQVKAHNAGWAGWGCKSNG